jgi:hypothetical protein
LNIYYSTAETNTKNNKIMQEITLRPQKSSSFWKRKSVLLLITLLAFAIALGIFAYQKNHLTSGEKSVAKADVANLDSAWLLKYFGTTDQNDPKVGGSEGDPDKDNLTNAQEQKYGTDPTNYDTDGDGLGDGYEVAYGSNPVAADNLVNGKDPTAVLGEINSAFGGKALVDPAAAEQIFNLKKPLVIPEIKDSELKIIETNEATVKTYTNEMNKILADYYNGNFSTRFSALFDTNNEEELKPIGAELDKYIIALHQIALPSEGVKNHKNFLIYFGALRKMVDVQDQIIKNPDDISLVGEIAYQARIMVALEQTAQKTQ